MPHEQLPVSDAKQEQIYNNLNLRPPMFKNSSEPAESVSRHSDSRHREEEQPSLSAGNSAGSEALSIAPFICISSALRRLLLQAKIASAHTQVAAVEGEPGTGKHLFAQTMHQQSALAPMSFRRSDAREWLASETDISVLTGTLYLDRVDLLAPTGQGLLLNLVKSLQDSPPPRFLLLVSAHASLRHLASQGHFLPDLAFRLSAVRFLLPPLRDHREDIAPVAQALIDRVCTRYRQPAAVLAPGTLPRLLQHGWPGNVRELASALECAILESKTGVIRPADIDLEMFQKAPNQRATQIQHAPGLFQTPLQELSFSNSAANSTTSYGVSLGGSLVNAAANGLNNQPRAATPVALDAESLTLNSAILRHIQYVLDLNRGNKLRAARQLAISRSTLYRILAGENYSHNPSSNSMSLPSETAS